MLLYILLYIQTSLLLKYKIEDQQIVNCENLFN